MSQGSAALEESAIKQHCKQLHLPTVGGQCARLAEEAKREHQGHLGYLEAVLLAELEDPDPYNDPRISGKVDTIAIGNGPDYAAACSWSKVDANAMTITVASSALRLRSLSIASAA